MNLISRTTNNEQLRVFIVLYNLYKNTGDCIRFKRSFGLSNNQHGAKIQSIVCMLM